MIENDVETYLKAVAEGEGMRTYKWVCPSVRGVPDQIVLAPIPPEHQAIVAKYIRFIETKAPDKTARGQQQLRHKELRKLGFQVHVTDGLAQVEEVIGDMA